MSAKIESFDRLRETLSRLRRGGKRVVHCHGTFDLIHPGHLVHFEEARALGDLLVVTLTAGNHVKKGPGRPFFNDRLRAKFLAGLSCVDLVSVVPFPAAKEAIEAVRPDIYCKGMEYKDKTGDVSGKLSEDIRTARRCGGKVAYVGSVVFSSSKLLRDGLETRSKALTQLCTRISKHTSAEKLRQAVEGFRDLRILVVGDIIFDRYSTVVTQGLTSKNQIISCRFVKEETQCGGALAVCRHLQQFAPRTQILGALGSETWASRLMDQATKKGTNLSVSHPDYISIVKQRFVDPRVEGKELSKLFSVNYLREGDISPGMEKEVLRRLRQAVQKADAVIIMDFGHGLLTPAIRKYLQREARLLVVNCQTNSNNFAFNLINRKYHRADAFAVDSTEMHLAVGKKKIHFEKELKKLARTLRVKRAWLTQGSVETIGWSPREGFVRCEPLGRAVVDTVGAGDAFISMATLAVAKGLPLDLATLLGQLAGAEAVGIVGNERPISKTSVLKGAMS
ncbi:MAG: cytidyltransferase, partial [Actinobacteria bacterium]|nr:cytidyltransferase [Actinomycetota bacterium]